MKIWVDDIRPAPDGYIWCKSVYDAIYVIEGAYLYHWVCKPDEEIEVLDIDHDAGDYAKYGGDYIKLLDWLEQVGISCPIHIHSMNPVGIQNMRAIIERNGWLEV